MPLLNTEPRKQGKNTGNLNGKQNTVQKQSSHSHSRQLSFSFTEPSVV